MDKKLETVLLIIWTQSLVAMIGSLFYSEVLGYLPCEICWFQRVLMYPLVVIYGLSLLKKDLKIALPGLFLSGIGFLLATYHYAIQKIPALREVGGSCELVPCHLQYVNYLGFITIPLLASIAFLIIFVLHLYVRKQSRRKEL